MAPKKSIPISEYRRLAEEGYSQSETARILGVKPQTVKVLAIRHNIAFVMGYINKEKRDANMAVQAQEG